VEEMNKPNVFISYSHRDTAWKDRLVSHLRVLERQGTLGVWETSDLPAGSDWSKQIDEAVKKADVAVLLVSPDFLASDFIVERELPTLFRRMEKEGTTVLPIILRPTAWSAIPQLAQLQFLNTDAKPLAAGSEYEVDQSLANIAKRIGEITAAIQERGASKALAKEGRPGKAPPSVAPKDGRYFISHSKIDGDFAELLQLKLEKEGFLAWIDTDRLGPGVDWRQEIDDAIRDAPAVIAVMSPEARESEYVTYEWAFAWGCGKQIIPLMLRQTPLHPRLATLQFLDFSNRISRPWAKLIAALKESEGKPKSTRPGKRTSNEG
jgi:hypothetical protein